MTVQFDVLDELSGVQAAWLTFRSPTIATASPPSIQRTATFHQYLTAPRIMAGTVTGSVTFPRFDRGGDWTVAQVCVIDEVKHMKCYTGDALKILGPTEITVISNRLTLTPEVDENPVGTQHTVTATLSNQNGPLSGRTILFSVAGANSASGTGTTDGSGQATFTYTGDEHRCDTITACHDGNTNGTCEDRRAEGDSDEDVGSVSRAGDARAHPAQRDTNNVGEEHCVTASRQGRRRHPDPERQGRLLGQRRQHRRRHGDHERER